MNGLNCIPALKALGEETRLRILGLLFKNAMGVNEIANELKMSQCNVSKHLRVMREAGLLEMRKTGKQHLYEVVPALTDQMSRDAGVLDLGCCTFRLNELPK